MREMRELSDEMEAGREVGREVGREHVDLNDPHDVFLELLHQVSSTIFAFLVLFLSVCSLVLFRYVSVLFV